MIVVPDRRPPPPWSGPGTPLSQTTTKCVLSIFAINGQSPPAGCPVNAAGVPKTTPMPEIVPITAVIALLFVLSAYTSRISVEEKGRNVEASVSARGCRQRCQRAEA